MVLLLLLALFTERPAAGETLLFQMLQASRIVWKLAIEISDRVP